jgi:hypothetical protein
MEWIPREKEKRTPKNNVDGRSTSSHDSKKFRTRSIEKLRAMAFGFRKRATAVKKGIDYNYYYYYYYYYYISCHRPFRAGNSLEPSVIPTAQASSFTLQ